MARIRDIMSRDVVTIGHGGTVLDAAALLAEREISFVVVMRGDRPAGVVSERDIVRKVAAHDRRASDAPISEVMSENFMRAGPEATIEDAVQKMINGSVRRLVVLDGGALAGVVTQTDLAGYLRSRLLIGGTVEGLGD